MERALQINEEEKLENLSFSVQDCCNLPVDWSEKFDLVVVFDVIHDIPRASQGLLEIRRCLKPGGKFFMMDIMCGDDPRENPPLIYTISLFSCMAQSLNYEGSEGLGATWGVNKARQMLGEAGFSNVTQLKSPLSMFMLMVCDK